MDGTRIASDICSYLIAFYKELQQSNLFPLKTLSEERYNELKQLYKNGICNAEIGFGLYFCSFAGKFKGGYARSPKDGYDFSKGAYNSALRLKLGIKDVQFYSLDYRELFKILPQRCLIYCDIPYINTTEYRFKFDHESYWKFIREQSNNHDIYTSSYIAPEDFSCVWQIERKTCLNTKSGGKEDRTEKLFKFKGKLDEQIVA